MTRDLPDIGRAEYVGRHFCPSDPFVTQSQPHQGAARAPSQLRSAPLFRSLAVQWKSLSRYVSLPPMTVSSTFVLRMSIGGIVRMSFDSTTRSASLPGVSVPRFCSSKFAYAPSRV